MTSDFGAFYKDVPALEPLYGKNACWNRSLGTGAVILPGKADMPRLLQKARAAEYAAAA